MALEEEGFLASCLSWFQRAAISAPTQAAAKEMRTQAQRTTSISMAGEFYLEAVAVEIESETMTNAAQKSIPPVTLPDLMTALGATEANLRWWEGDGTLPKAQRDDEGRLLWDVNELRHWSKTDAAQKFIAGRK